MALIIKLLTKVKKRSNTRPKSLILHIPAQVRDLMDLKHDTPINLEVCIDDETKKKYIKIYIADD